MTYFKMSAVAVIKHKLIDNKLIDYQWHSQGGAPPEKKVGKQGKGITNKMNEHRERKKERKIERKKERNNEWYKKR